MLILLTALMSGLLTRLQIRLNGRLEFTAAPRADRWHSVPTPSSGGLAIFLSCAAAYWVVCPGRYPRIAMGIAVLWVFGFLDDRLRLTPLVKLGVEAAAACLVLSSGIGFPLNGLQLLSLVILLCWILMLTNAFNLIDNMDGLCAGVVIIICGFRYWLLTAEGHSAEAEPYAIIGAAFAGFLIFNYHPARIFMGDCGSLPAGFALSTLVLTGPRPHGDAPEADFSYWALTFAYPIFDVVLVAILRKLSGRPISMGGRDHSSHRLASLGLGQRQVVWILWLLTAIGSSLGLMVYWMPETLFVSSGIVTALLVIFGLSLATRPGYPQPEIMRMLRR